MALGILMGICRAMRRKRSSTLNILSSKRGPRDYYKGKNCKSTGFHTRKGGYVVMDEKLPHYVVPDLTNFKAVTVGQAVMVQQLGNFLRRFKLEQGLSLGDGQLKPYVAQCSRDATSSETTAATK